MVRGRGPWARFVRGGRPASMACGAATAGCSAGRCTGASSRRSWRWLSLVVAFAMVPLGLIKFEFVPLGRPAASSWSIAELPPGSSLAATDEVMRQVDAKRAWRSRRSSYALTTAGVGGAGASGIAAGSARYGRVVVLQDRTSARRGDARPVQGDGRSGAAGHDIPGASLSASRPTGGGGGPGQPVQVRVTGDDLATRQPARQAGRGRSSATRPARSA